MNDEARGTPQQPDARLEASVRGRVQGVGYRYFVIREASRLGLTGWVSNEHDGSVRLVAEGDRGALDRLETALHDGPYGAIVEEVRGVRMPASGRFVGFTVRSTGHTGD
jgi:acylphosphatase